MSDPIDSIHRQSILVVDDTLDNLTLMAGLLKDLYKVKIANTGEKALKLAQSDSLPDLILLDIMMPGLSGYDVCKVLKDDPKTRGIPIIFLTAMTATEDEKKGLEMGAADFITKPINPPTFLARIKSHIALGQRTKALQEISGKLSRYIPPQVCQMIFNGMQDSGIHAKRKKLTIFFSDIKDFTSTTADLEPEDLTYLLNKYFDEMSRIALDYGATIDKFVGDAMLMFFGDPETQGVKEDALRCVRMATAMQRRMADLQALWRDKGYENPLSMRIGINTGFCSVGNFGSTHRMDYTVIGTEVNLAARLEQSADPDGIVMSYETYSLVREEITAEERPLIQLKGITGGVRTFAVCDILEGIESDRRFVQKNRPGLRVALDLDRLFPESREDAVRDLEDLIYRIRASG